MLARVTISAPRRRVDVALPEETPVADLLPELLHQAGEGLADDGERHGGWLLRRTDGEPVDPRSGLRAQGVRDGEILHLVPARERWPEPEYDDVVEAIAAGAREVSAAWGARTTRVAAISAAAAAFAAGLVARPQWIVALAVAVLLLVAGVAVARGFGEAAIGAALAAGALPYAFLTGLDGGPLAGCVAFTVAALLGGAGSGAARPVFAAATTAGLLGGGGALLSMWLPAPGAAAVLLAVLACGLGALPRLVVHLARLDATHVAVRRADELLTGALAGHALATAATCAALVRSGGRPGLALVGVAGGVLLLRARLFAAVRQRVPVLLAGCSVLGAALFVATPAAAVTPAAVVVGLVILGMGTAYARRRPSPYLGRAADLLDVALVVSVVPVACAVLGLYGRVGQLGV